jgi:hypothetical protein
MQLVSSNVAQTLFLPKRSHVKRQTLHLVTRATLNPLVDVALSIGPIDNAALLALPAIGGAVLT